MVAVVIAILALALSALSLWRTLLAPARIFTTWGVVRLRVYPFKVSGDHWVMPAMHLSLAFANEGARAGIVDDVRIVMSYPDVFPGYNHELFEPVTVRREPMGLKGTFAGDREVEFEEGSEWMPVLVLPKETVTRHLVLQALAWDTPPLGRARGTLEVKLRDKPWQTLERWSFDLDSHYWHHLYGGSPVPGLPDSRKDRTPRLSPTNLQDKVAAKAIAELGPRPYDELEARYKVRQKEAAIARGEASPEDESDEDRPNAEG